MKIAFVRIAIGAITALTGIGGASAQTASKQTPENAQKFLATVLADAWFSDRRLGMPPKSTRAERNFTMDGARWYGVDSTAWENARRKLQRLKITAYRPAEDVCTASFVLAADKVTVYYPRTKYYDPVGRGPYFYDEYYDTLRDVGEWKIDIDWKKVTSVEASGNTVIVITTHVPTYTYLDTSSKQVEFEMADSGMAARVAYAGEVIRIKCDPTASLGF